jgi:hypothetical protein
MTKFVFYSFHYDRDPWRASQVLDMSTRPGQRILPSQEWADLKNRGVRAVKEWLTSQVAAAEAVVVLTGAETAHRPLINYEIRKAWILCKPLVGIRIHGLADLNDEADTRGDNPFANVRLQHGRTAADYVPLIDPQGATPKEVRASICAHLQHWVTEAYVRSPTRPEQVELDA